MTIPFLSVRPKSIKLKVSPRFPAQLFGGAGIDVNKANGNYTVALDVGEFGQSLVLPANPFTLVFDPIAESYVLVPPSVFAATVPEAPTDGPAYGRSNATWVKVVPLTGATMTGYLILNNDPTVPLGAVTKQYADTITSSLQTYAKQLLRAYLSGLILSTTTASITFTVSPGTAIDSTYVDMMLLTSSLNKTTAAWAVGTSNGALDTGTIAASTWYFVHLIKRTDTGVVDALISLSPTAPTFPPGYTLRRRIGAMLTNASSQWTLFHQLGDEFLWDARVTDANAIAIAATTATLQSLTVPVGIQVNAYFDSRFNFVTNASNLLFTSPDESDQAASTSLSSLSCSATATSNSGHFNIRTNNLGQIRVRANATGPP
jgi:hypothetical protein